MSYTLMKKHSNTLFQYIPAMKTYWLKHTLKNCYKYQHLTRKKHIFIPLVT